MNRNATSHTYHGINTMHAHQYTLTSTIRHKHVLTETQFYKNVIVLGLISVRQGAIVVM